MADLTITVSSKDEASETFKAIGRAVVDTGKKTESAAAKGGKGFDNLTKSVLKAEIAYGALKKVARVFINFVSDSIDAYVKSGRASAEFVKNMAELDKQFAAVKVNVGGFIAQLDQSVGATKALTTALEMLNEVMNPEDRARQDRYERKGKLLDRLSDVNSQLSGEGGGDFKDADDLRAEKEEIDGLIAEVDAESKKASEALMKRLAEEARRIASAGKDKVTAYRDGSKDLLDAIRETNAQIRKEREAEAASRDGLLSQMAFKVKISADEQESIDAAARTRVKAMIDAMNREAAAQGYGRLDPLAAPAETAASLYAKEMEAEAKEAAKKSRDAGIAVGMAFISGLDSQLSQMQNGGEFDMGSMIAQMIPTLVTLAMMANPATAPFAGLVGAAAGMIAKQAFAGGGKPGRYHSGGYVDDRPRFHDGGLAGDEVEAVLQKGEYVVSRGEVARAGGPQAVGDAVRSGGGTTITVQAFDSLSFQDYMGDRGGRGMVRAIEQLGRGEFAAHLRRKMRAR